MSVVTLDGVTFKAPLVHVVFIGINGQSSMMQTIDAPPIELDASMDLSLKDITVRAAFERFNLSAEDAVESLGLAVGGMTLFRSTALTLAPKTKLTDLDARVVVTSSDESAAAPTALQNPPRHDGQTQSHLTYISQLPLGGLVPRL